ncbi:MAG: hypothetical protein LAT83_23340, partial [Kiritimatiellae bacterium]|nr:hypothetical protein [Kiritimatiellia bacterium]
QQTKAENHSPDDKTQADFEARALAKSAGLRTFEMPLKLVPFEVDPLSILSDRQCIHKPQFDMARIRSNGRGGAALECV